MTIPHNIIACAIYRWLALLSLLLPTIGNAEVGLPEPSRISEHAWAWIGPFGPPTEQNRGFRMNMGFIVGNDRVAVIDSGYSSEMASSMIDHIRRITDRPIAYVVNTNTQPHRILGNSTFRRVGAEVVAAEAAVSRITGEGAALASRAVGILKLPSGSIQPPGTPDLILTESTQLNLGGVALNLIPVGTAHTAGSLIVEVVEDMTVFTGDVLYRGRLLSILSVSRVDGWIDAFDELRKFSEARFVPGHGEPGGLASFEDSTYAYLTTLKAHMDKAVDEGIDLQEAIASLDQSQWQHLADFDALAGRNAHQTYLEREAGAFE
jgi:glyoxylase-like metal-dependent hydrolase (beta-lactamase superfamily II)